MYVRIVFGVSTAYLNGYIVFDKFNLSQQTTTKGFFTHIVNIVVIYLNNIFNRKKGLKGHENSGTYLFIRIDI